MHDREPVVPIADISAQLSRLTCEYAFYCRISETEPLFLHNCDLFLPASIIKLPILFAWAQLEREGQADRAEMCDLDSEPQVQGAGLSWLLRTRRLQFGDVLLLMIALSDNLCTNHVIRRIGIERLNRLLSGPLQLPDAVVQRRLMDYDARDRGLENRISARDCIRLFELRDALSPSERAWIEPMLLANIDLGLFLRNMPRDCVDFYHKTGSIPGLLHDWGYTENTDLFLLTQGIKDTETTYEVFGRLGEIIFAGK